MPGTRDYIANALAAQRTFFAGSHTEAGAFQIQAMRRLREVFVRYNEIGQALEQDLGRRRLEVFNRPLRGMRNELNVIGSALRRQNQFAPPVLAFS